MQAYDSQIEHLNILKTSVKTTYDATEEIYCPVLEATIVFNSIGFRHLLIKPDGTVRDVKEAVYKLTLFPLAVPTIKFATAVVDERDIKVPVGRGRRRKCKDAKTYAITVLSGASSQ